MWKAPPPAPAYSGGQGGEVQAPADSTSAGAWLCNRQTKAYRVAGEDRVGWTVRHIDLSARERWNELYAQRLAAAR